MQSNLFFVPRAERTGEIVQLVNRVNVGKSGGLSFSRIGKTMENFFLRPQYRVPRFPRLLRNPRYLDPGQVLQYWLAQFSIISGPSCGKFREPGLFWMNRRVATRRRNRKSVRKFRIIDYTACNYSEPLDYHSRISTSEDKNVRKNRWGWIEASQHVLYSSSPISIRSIE